MSNPSSPVREIDGAVVVAMHPQGRTRSCPSASSTLTLAAWRKKLEPDVIEDGFRFDGAGRQLTFVAAAGQPGLEIRVLENFLPTLPTQITKNSEGQHLGRPCLFHLGCARAAGRLHAD